MNQTSKQLTKIDYLTVVFCPDEIARLRFDAKIAFGKGDFASYKEAYNAMLCAELFDQQATDDLDLDVNESVVFDSDYYYDQLLKTTLVTVVMALLMLSQVKNGHTFSRTLYAKPNVTKHLTH